MIQAMNLGSGTETKVKDLAQMIIEITGSRSEIRYAPKRDWDKSEGSRQQKRLAD
ncbi:MAG: hypothetical protein QXS20_05400 [Candidatus Thorarchaeota archaeon]